MFACFGDEILVRVRKAQGSRERVERDGTKQGDSIKCLVVFCGVFSSYRSGRG